MVLVDWTMVTGRFRALYAAVPIGGRAVTIYLEVHHEKKLGNTRAVCRKCYVHPAVVDTYLDGTLRETLSRRAEKRLAKGLHALPPEEAAVLMLLRDRLRGKS